MGPGVSGRTTPGGWGVGIVVAKVVQSNPNPCVEDPNVASSRQQQFTTSKNKWSLRVPEVLRILAPTEMYGLWGTMGGVGYQMDPGLCTHGGWHLFWAVMVTKCLLSLT